MQEGGKFTGSNISSQLSSCYIARDTLGRGRKQPWKIGARESAICQMSLILDKYVKHRRERDFLILIQYLKISRMTWRTTFWWLKAFITWIIQDTFACGNTAWHVILLVYGTTGCEPRGWAVNWLNQLGSQRPNCCCAISAINPLAIWRSRATCLCDWILALRASTFWLLISASAEHIRARVLQTFVKIIVTCGQCDVLVRGNNLILLIVNQHMACNK
jgi:hypothetical protein